MGFNGDLLILPTTEKDPKISGYTRKYELYPGEYHFIQRNNSFMKWTGFLMSSIAVLLVGMLYFEIHLEIILEIYCVFFGAVGFSLMVKGHLAGQMMTHFFDSHRIRFEARFSDFGLALKQGAIFSQFMIVLGIILDFVSIPIAMMNIYLGLVVFSIGTILALCAEQRYSTIEPLKKVDWNRVEEERT